MALVKDDRLVMAEGYGFAWAALFNWRPGPRACPGVLFRRTRPWLKATGEWRAEGSSLDSQPYDSEAFLAELDRALWRAVEGVTAWPRGNLFDRFL